MSASNTLGNNAFFNRLDANNVNFKNHSDYNELLQKIETNTENITTNTSDIATNTSNIATNTSNIETNTSDLSKINELLEFDTIKKRINPIPNNGEISLGYRESNTNNRARFDEIHCRDIIASTHQVNEDIRFYTTENKEVVRIDAANDGAGGQLEFFTKDDTTETITRKLIVNKKGALGIGNPPNYGTSGQVLTSAGSGSTPSWSPPALLSYAYFNRTAPYTLPSANTQYPIVYDFTTTSDPSGNIISTIPSEQINLNSSGIYKIDISLTTKSNVAADRITDGELKVYVGTPPTLLQTPGSICYNYSHASNTTNTANISCIIQLNDSGYIKFSARANGSNCQIVPGTNIAIMKIA